MEVASAGMSGLGIETSRNEHGSPTEIHWKRVFGSAFIASGVCL